MSDAKNLSEAPTGVASDSAQVLYATGSNVTVGTPPTFETAVREPWVLDFGFKSDPVEVEYEGEIGLICEGWASKYLEEDASGEQQMPGAFSIISEEWGAQKEPLVLYNHALDTVIRGRPIGRGIGLKQLPDGVQVRVFIPRNAADKWEDKRARKRFADIYNGIKTRSIAAFSVGGAFWRMGKKLLNWATTELSITPTPCLASATFSLGSKALVEKYGSLPVALDDTRSEQSVLGKVTRPHWNSVMGFAKQDGDAALHDHLLGMAYAPEYQGTHDSEDCSICSDRRDMMGIKAEQGQEGDDAMDESAAGAKATVTKSEPDGDHPSSHYLSVGDPQKPTTWKLRVKDASGKVAPRLLGACHAALTVGYRGNKVDLPAGEKERCLAKLKRLYKQEGMDWPEDAGSGGKADDLDADAVLRQATDLLAEYGRGVKSGRKHSRETKKAVQTVVDHLTGFFNLGKPEDDDTDEASETSED